MIRELALKNFRGVGEGRLELFPMTVLLGANNSGKTTVLEALYLLYPPSPIYQSTYKGALPGMHSTTILTVAEAIHAYHATLDSRGYRFLIHGYNGEAVIACRSDGALKALVFKAMDDYIEVLRPEEESIGPSLDLETLMSEMETRPAHVICDLGSSGGVDRRDTRAARCLFMKPHIAEMAMNYLRERWGLIRGRGLTGKVAAELSRLVNEDYDDLTLEPHVGGGLSLNLILRKTKAGIRLGDMGDGIRMLVLAMLLKELIEPELILWDDVEAFMSPSSLIYLSQWLAELVEQGAQVVVATHSREAAKLLAGAAEEAGQEAKIVLLALREGVLKHRVLTLDEVEALEKAGVDVRMAEGFLL